MFNRIAYPHRFRIGIPERVPDNIEPIAVAQLRRFVPLVRGETNRVPARASFNLDPANAGDRIAITSLRVSWPETSDIESNFFMPDSHALPSSGNFVGNNHIFCCQFRPPA